MRGSILAAAAAVLLGNANAAGHRHAHELFHNKRGGSTGEVCKPECSTVYSTIYGEATWKPNPPPPTPTYTPATVPTPIPQTCPTPGTYTFPATTVVVTETTTVCAASTTKVPTGTHTLGGVTTVVTTATTVTCPYATTTTNTKGVVTSVIKTTTYVCPSAGTYTIAPITTTVTKTNTVVVIPVVTTYCPGTYTAPAVVTTVTETDVVVYCPFTSPTPSSSAYPTSKPSSPPAEYPAAKPSEKPATSPPASSPPATGGLGTGKHPAITYTPYDQNGGCKSASAVMTDLKELKDKEFSTVRVYSTDCDGLPNIGAACEAYGMKMIIGVFIGKPGCDNGNPDVATQIAAIKAWGKWSLVEMIIVGNEAGHGGFCTGTELASLVKQVKDIAVAGGSNAPVTTADTVDVWQNPAFSGPLCAVVDVVGVQAHPYFNAMVSPSIAGEFVKGQLEIVKAICGKPGYVTETGWPSECKANGLATCSPSDQETAMKSIVGSCGSESILFSMFDDLWKDDGECQCEKKWGIYNILGSL